MTSSLLHLLPRPEWSRSCSNVVPCRFWPGAILRTLLIHPSVFIFSHLLVSMLTCQGTHFMFWLDVFYTSRTTHLPDRPRWRSVSDTGLHASVFWWWQRLHGSSHQGLSRLKLRFQTCDYSIWFAMKWPWFRSSDCHFKTGQFVSFHIALIQWIHDSAGNMWMSLCSNGSGVELWALDYENPGSNHVLRC